MSLSYKNGLSYNPNFDIPNIFDKTWVIVYSAILIGIVPLTAIFNFIVFRQYKLAFKRSLMFLPGLIALGVAYVLGGIGPKYTPINLLFSLSNISMIIGLVLYFSDLAFLNKKEDTMKYISMFMVVTLLVISFQVIGIYFINDVIVNGTIDKVQIVTGWGIHNNFAGYICLSLPFIFYLMIKEEKSWIYFLLIIFAGLATVLTMSRNGLLVFAIEIIIGLIAYIKIKKIKRKTILISALSLLGFFVLSFAIFHHQIIELFNHFIELGFSLNGRDELYKIAWDSFLANPIFGSGWFVFETSTPDYYISPNPFSPSFKAHNIILQILSATGIVGLIGFVYFNYDLHIKVFKKNSFEKTTLYFAILILMISSIFDNFFFDYGFERYLGLFYIGLSIYHYDTKELIN
jgi:O-antigen ligase